jgi:isoleucyl-tRNA synthetase
MKNFKKIDNKPFPQIEEEVLKFWKENNTFKRSVDERPDNNPFVFVDGPPFVTGNPHYGSLLPSIAKDVVPRYQTMKGKKVRRVWGWDCHGLPIEEKVSIKLGITSRKQLEEDFGVTRYVKECKDYVESSITSWEWYIDRVGRWVDLKNAYYTMKPEFNESVIWGFKQIYDKGYIYKGKRVSLYSTDTSTPVSDFEVAMDPDNYKDTTDLSVFVKFELSPDIFNDVVQNQPVYLLAWTTTPWTIPANFALAVNPEYQYVLVKFEDTYFVVAKERLEYTFNDATPKGTVKVLKTFKGSDLNGLSYKPAYNYYVDISNENDFKIYLSADVTKDDGTGVLHIAPAFGEVDFNLGKLNGLSIISDIDAEGAMTIDPWKGKYLRGASKLIAVDMQEKGILFRSQDYMHRLPYYRGRNPLIYMAQDAYFINLKKVNEKILSDNENVNWVPEHFKKGRFEKTVESAPDWCISRNRYWATIMPIWQDETGENLVVGSIDEITKYTNQLEKREDGYYFEGEPFRLHRDICDQLILEKDGKKYKRIPEVLDGWLDSGSVPFAEYHYPFENKDVFEKAFPADYIVEYTGQIRAWFQMLFRVSEMIFDEIPFKNVLVTGVLAGTDGRKMSKSFGNYPDPKLILETIGGDALRLYFMGSPVMLGESVSFDEVELRNKSKNVLLPLLNSLNYFLIYAQENKWSVEKLQQSTNILDKWINVRLNQATVEVSQAIESYHMPTAVRSIESFVTDLSTWYVRRSRGRITNNDNMAISTLYTVLLEFSKVAAPVIPFITEKIYQELVETADTKLDSVHLCMYPESAELTEQDKNLLTEMEQVREYISFAHSLRKEINIPVRQPLETLYIKSEKSLSSELVEIIKEESNVKDVEFVAQLKETGEIKVKDDKIALKITLSEDLLLEGDFRALIRKIQQARKVNNLNVGDKIDLQYTQQQEKVINTFKVEIVKITNVVDFIKSDVFNVIKR